MKRTGRSRRHRGPRWAPWIIGGVALAAAALLVVRWRFESLGRAAAPVYGYRLVNVYPHDPEAFTQGLIYRNGFLYESTGMNGRSSLREVRLGTGEVIRRRDVDPQYFAEGLTDWGDSLVQLTWTSHVAFVYGRSGFEARGTFRYEGEGWGLTHDERRLIMSDGSATLRFLDPRTFRETGRLTVEDRGFPVGKLNELEFVKGEIYANVWHSERIAMISPASGRVVGWIDLEGIMPGAGGGTSGDDVLNGIAYDAGGGRLFVTGKLWPKLFEIELVRR
ncbi:MAG TPA: glutaminyl-peptide cyclotransferase [Candidatus Bathyarchaeia archaeon]|nr:glutaminyl-peptide cyclotransferase [Candidatus Bathyarchaeia archaeon]